MENTFGRPQLKKPKRLRFNILVAGRSGLGKSTFLTTLFMAYAIEELRLERQGRTIEQTRGIELLGTCVLEFDTGDIEIYFYDSAGYGDVLNDESICNVVNFVEEKHLNWTSIRANEKLEEEVNAIDERIHCLFYFIAPHRMSPIDADFIGKLSAIAPVVPIIAKSDMMTMEERAAYLPTVQNMIKDYKIFNFGERSTSFDDKERTSIEQPREDTVGRLVASAESNTISAAPGNASTSASVHSVAVSTFSATSEGFSFPPDYEINSEHDAENMSVASGLSVSDNIPLSAAAAAAAPEGGAINEEQNKNVESTTTTTTEDATLLSKVRNIFAVVCDMKGFRRYPFGTVEVHNPEHSDFPRLRLLLFHHEGGSIRDMMNLTRKMSIALLKSDKRKRFARYWTVWRPAWKFINEAIVAVFWSLVLILIAYLLLGGASTGVVYFLQWLMAEFMSPSSTGSSAGQGTPISDPVAAAVENAAG